MPEITVEQGLKIISQAWGRQRGYAFFPTIRGDAKTKTERIQSYREGPAFMWPKDREEILVHLKDNWNNDVYWCPNLFEYPRRKADFAMDEMCLWADLDEVDPRKLEDYPPTIAWETSPGRWQALWLGVAGQSMLGASWPGRENQRMSTFIDADPSGWDATQLLRIPGWINHKPEHREKYGEWRGGLVWPDWRDRPRYQLDDFEGLPETEHVTQWEGVLEDVVELMGDPRHIWTKVRLKLPLTTRQLYKSRRVGGDRSETMWRLERDFADAGLKVPEIVALMKDSPWNKYSGRQDELRRLVTEANKAVALKVEKHGESKPEDRDEQGDTRKELQGLTTLFINLKPPVWIVKDVWNEGACGFIAGQPKLHKSWMAFDLALSVATGTDFLSYWKVISPGPVMYLQEEDHAPEIKRRFSIMWPQKQADRVTKDHEGGLWWEPPTDMVEPDISALIGGGLVLSDPDWQDWLDDQLSAGRGGVPYKMMILDPLLMMLGDVDDNKAPQMTEQIFKPIKQLSRKHEVAVCIVHHMRKGQNEGRGGQMMLGSVANHAWAEDAMYLSYGRGGVIEVERESKSSAYLKFKIKGVAKVDQANTWLPQITNVRGLWDEDSDEEEGPARVQQGRPRAEQDMLTANLVSAVRSGKKTTQEIREAVDAPMTTVRRRLRVLKQRGVLGLASGKWYVKRSNHG